MVVGAKTTLTVHEAPTASEAGQLCVAENWPVVVTLDTASAVLPVLLSVMPCAADTVETACPPNASAVDEADPEVWSPVPLTETVLVPTPVGMENVPAAAPIAEGANVTLYVQVAPAGNEAPQVVLATLKGELMLAAETVVLVFPELVSVTACELEVLPTVCVLKARLEGDAASTASKPVPPSVTVWFPPSVPIVKVPACAPIVLGANEMFAVQLPPTGSVEPQLCVAEN
jgi:hypothetical protein